MRRILVSLLAAAALLGGAGCQSNGDAAARESGPTLASARGTATATLIVHGMGCPLCANNIDQQLLAVPGVEQVRVNLGNGSVLVTMAEGEVPAAEQLADAVQQSGYTLVRIDRP